jgi:hypothetical protein
MSVVLSAQSVTLMPTVREAKSAVWMAKAASLINVILKHPIAVKNLTLLQKERRACVTS